MLCSDHIDNIHTCGWILDRAWFNVGLFAIHTISERKKQQYIKRKKTLVRRNRDSPSPPSRCQLRSVDQLLTKRFYAQRHEDTCCKRPDPTSTPGGTVLSASCRCGRPRYWGVLVYGIYREGVVWSVIGCEFSRSRQAQVCVARFSPDPGTM